MGLPLVAIPVLQSCVTGCRDLMRKVVEVLVSVHPFAQLKVLLQNSRNLNMAIL